MSIEPSTSEALRAKFAARLIGKKPKITCTPCSKSQYKVCDKHEKQRCRDCKGYLTTEHMHVDFLGHAHVTERLLDVDPDWDWEPLAFDPNTGLPMVDANGGLWIRLTVGGKSRIGYGGADGKRGDDAVKETIGDAIKNAAMRFGVGLALWMKEGPAADDVPVREVERPAQSPADRRSELRGQIAVLAKTKNQWSPAELATEFTLWSGSQALDITKPDVSVAVLAEYLNHLEHSAAPS